MAEFEENCTHSCETCSADCASRQGEQKDPHEKMHEGCSVKKVIGVVSGKGGVGKSMVTALSAIAANRNGLKTGILDADITGPSIPKMFGIHEKAEVSNMGLLPASTPTEMEIMSLNLLTDNETDPVIWRGPVIAGAVKQFWNETAWGDIDYLFVDMPPGTGDVPLTVFQSLPVDGIIVVTTPQQLVGMIVEKAVKMAEMMKVPVLGLIENMSTYTCPDCGKQHAIFGESHLDSIAAEHHIPVLARLPIQPALASLMDTGTIELFEGDFMQPAADRLCALLPR